MLRSSTLKLFLLLSAALQVSISAEPILTRNTQFATKNPFTVAIGSQLFTVSRLSRRVIVNSTIENYKSCDIPVNTNQGPVSLEIKAAAIGSQKIVVWNKRGYDVAPGGKIYVNYTILLVDPWACSVAEVPTPMEVVSTIAPFEPPQITVRHDNTFDVFYWSQSICSPCRYDVEGRRVQLQHNLQPERSVATEFYLHELSDEHKYAYTFNFGSDTAALKVLDRDFNVLDSTNIKSVVKDFAILDVAGTSYIGAVQKDPKNRSTYNYTLFEYKNKLRPVFSKFLEVPFGIYPAGANLKIDSKGFSYVTLWKGSFSNTDTNITLTQYDSNGRIVNDELDIAKVAFNQQYRVQTFLLEDKEYCLVIHEIGWESDVTKIKCFNV